MNKEVIPQRAQLRLLPGAQLQLLTIQSVQNPAVQVCCQLTDLGLQLLVLLSYSFQTFL